MKLVYSYIIFLTACFFALIKTAQANPYWEPSIAGSTGNLRGFAAGASTETVSFNGALSGGLVSLKVGGNFSDVIAFLDVQGLFLTNDQTEDSMDRLITAGVGFGYTSTFLPIRWYGSFDFLNQGRINLSATNRDDNALTQVDSFGYRAGIGYYITESIVANFQYQGIDVEDNTNFELGLQYRVFSFGLSIPLEGRYPEQPWRARRRAARLKPINNPAPAAAVAPNASGGDALELEPAEPSDSDTDPPIDDEFQDFGDSLDTEA